MKTWTERLPGIIAFIESGNGLAKLKAKKELEKMAFRADKLKIIEKEINKSGFIKTKEPHKKRHIELHKALDELFADYIGYHSNETNFIGMSLRKLLDWSFEQTKNPTKSK